MSSRTPKPVEKSSRDGYTRSTRIVALYSDDHLRSSTRVLIDGCWQSGDPFVGIVLFVDSRQVELASPIEAWIMRFLEPAGGDPEIVTEAIGAPLVARPVGHHRADAAASSTSLSATT